MLRQDLYNTALAVLVNRDVFTNNNINRLQDENNELLSNILSYNFYNDSSNVPEDYTKTVLAKIEHINTQDGVPTINKIKDIFPETSYSYLNIDHGYWITVTGIFTAEFMSKLSNYLWIGAFTNRDYNTLSYLISHRLYGQCVIDPEDVMLSYAEYYINAIPTPEKTNIIEMMHISDTKINPTTSGVLLLDLLDEEGVIELVDSKWILIDKNFIIDIDRLENYLFRVNEYGDYIC